MSKRKYQWSSVAEEGEERDLKPSRSAKKRAATAVQELGFALAMQDEQLWETLELPLSLTQQLLQLKNIKSNEARRRQVQYIGRLMRQLSDADLEAITLAVSNARPNAKKKASFLL